MSEFQGLSVAYHTLGCKVNQYDTQAMRERFEAEGYRTVPFSEAADIYLINTCTVTGTGDKKSLQLIRRVAREHPESDIIVAGCLAQRAGEEALLPGVRLVIGTQRRSEVVSLYEDTRRAGEQAVAVDALQKTPFERLNVRANAEHLRAYMKIQEGCNRYCSYCVIPSVRGPIRSRPIKDIAEEAQALAAAGFKEIVLTGIHLTSYGLDMKDGTTLLDAIRAAHDVPGVRRIRLGSLEPVVATRAFAERLAALPKLCRQFHLSLQSGSDVVLRAMRRRYNAEEFLAACRNLREAMPQCAITTDVITGFPGETEADFDETLRVCREAAFARMHVFPYSEREGTPAARMPGSVPMAVREERAGRLIALGKMLEAEALQRMVDCEVDILVERNEGGAQGVGYTGEYMRARVDGAQGEIVRAVATRVEAGTLVCQRL